MMLLVSSSLVLYLVMMDYVFVFSIVFVVVVIVVFSDGVKTIFFSAQLGVGVGVVLLIEGLWSAVPVI